MQNNGIRKKIYDVIETDSGNNLLSKAYDYFMIAVIGISLVPLLFKSELDVFNTVDSIAVVVFVIDYILRLITADIRLEERGVLPFLKYPFTPMALVDLVSILPFFFSVNSGYRLLRMIRLGRSLRVLRLFKTVRYSSSITIIVGVMKKSRESLLTVCSMAIAYIFISALIMFNFEPDIFNSFFDAVYWATESLTTVGYGDIYAVTTVGKIITMVSSMFGIAIVAMPAGIITAGYMTELQRINAEKTGGEPVADDPDPQ